MARTRSAIGRQSRAKGAAFERDVVHALLPLYPSARRNLSQTRSARREGPDVLGTPWWLELTCGRIDEPRLRAKWAQACSDAAGPQPPYELGSGDRSAPVYSYGPPVLVVRPDRRSPFVLLEARTLGVTDAPGVLVRLSLDDWLGLLLTRSQARTRGPA